MESINMGHFRKKSCPRISTFDFQRNPTKNIKKSPLIITKYNRPIAMVSPYQDDHVMDIAIEEMKSNVKRYSSNSKIKDMSLLLLYAAKKLGFKNINLLEFYGGGIFHNMFRQIFDYDHILSVDSDKSIGEIMAKLDEPNVTFVNKELSDVIENFKEIIMYSCNFTYLDYCGWWNESKCREIEKLSKLLLHANDGGVFGVTINKSHRHYKGSSKVFDIDFEVLFKVQVGKLFNGMEVLYEGKYINNGQHMRTFLFGY
jgi:hypothetical protein